MKIIKYIVFYLFVTVVVIAIAGFFLPSEVHVERSAEINAPQELVFDQVIDLRKWELWSPWLEEDAQMQLTYSGPPQGDHSKVEWKSERLGNGSVSILHSERPVSITLNQDFMEDGPHPTGTLLFEKINQGTKVTWSLDIDFGLDIGGRYMGLFFDRFAGEDLEKGLHNLKVFCEKHVR